jgi:uncharacterized protein
MSEFAYVFGPGDRPALRTDPDAWTEEDSRIGGDHYERLRRETIEGRVIFAGLSLDGVGPAIVVIEADSAEDAKRFMEEDPFVANGLFTATLHPFAASLMRASDGPG